MIYLKYIDPKANNDNTFATVKDLEKFKVGTIEAVGHLVQEDDESLYIAMQKIGDKFRKILFIPKANILERDDSKAVELAEEVSFTDVQLAFPTANATLDKLKALGKPCDVLTVGFVVRDSKEDILLAMERNVEGAYRTYAVFPKIYEKRNKK